MGALTKVCTILAISFSWHSATGLSTGRRWLSDLPTVLDDVKFVKEHIEMFEPDEECKVVLNSCTSSVDATVLEELTSSRDDNFTISDTPLASISLFARINSTIHELEKVCTMMVNMSECLSREDVDAACKYDDGWEEFIDNAKVSMSDANENCTSHIAQLLHNFMETHNFNLTDVGLDGDILNELSHDVNIKSVRDLQLNF
eukprot:CFRG5569T1